jgi:hypothetical protein
MMAAFLLRWYSLRRRYCFPVCARAKFRFDLSVDRRQINRVRPFFDFSMARISIFRFSPFSVSHPNETCIFEMTPIFSIYSAAKLVRLDKNQMISFFPKAVRDCSSSPSALRAIWMFRPPSICQHIRPTSHSCVHIHYKILPPF